MTPEERFWGRVDRSAGEGKCWLWTGYRNRQGYGRAGLRGMVTGAHRIAWQIANGPIPEGLFVLHSCDVPACCNPAHLRTGTAGHNAWDRSKRNRNGATGRRTAITTEADASANRIRRSIRTIEYNMTALRAELSKVMRELSDNDLRCWLEVELGWSSETAQAVRDMGPVLSYSTGKAVITPIGTRSGWVLAVSQFPEEHAA